MTIGEISQEIGLSADTLRYYEKIGLLPNVPRDNSGISANERDKEEVKMTIGEISQEIGLSADTLRYYEKIGLLPNVPRDNSGKRNYDENFINWIKFIKYHKK